MELLQALLDEQVLAEDGSADRGDALSVGCDLLLEIGEVLLAHAVERSKSKGVASENRVSGRRRVFLDLRTETCRLS